MVFVVWGRGLVSILVVVKLTRICKKDAKTTLDLENLLLLPRRFFVDVQIMQGNVAA